jgi:hypothetical protein
MSSALVIPLSTMVVPLDTLVCADVGYDANCALNSKPTLAATTLTDSLGGILDRFSFVAQLVKIRYRSLAHPWPCRSPSSRMM